MTKHDHKAPARPVPTRTTNPLGRPYWLLALAENEKQHEAAHLSGLCMGIHAVSRILANSEAFRDIQSNSIEVEPGHWPLDPQLTEELFAALYFLSHQAKHLTQPAEGDPAFE